MSSSFAYNAFQERYAYIETGYRERTSSLWNCITSLFRIHNESFNIWSHLVASLYYVYNTLYIYNSDSNNRQVQLLHSSTLSVCFMLSASYHLLCNMPSYFKIALIFDVTGVLCMMVVNVGTAIYTITLHPNFNSIFQFYYLLCYIIIAIMSVIRVQLLLFHNRGVRGCIQYVIFLFLVSYWIPCIIIQLYMSDMIALNNLLSVWGTEYCGWIVVGILFALNLPDSILPPHFNKLDYIGNSHNLFHVLVVLMSKLHSHNLITYRA